MAEHYIVHYTPLFHNQGGYCDSLIQQALELPPLSQVHHSAMNEMNEISCKIGAFGYTLYCTLHTAVSQPGRLFPQPYTASIRVTSLLSSTS